MDVVIRDVGSQEKEENMRKDRVKNRTRRLALAGAILAVCLVVPAFSQEESVSYLGPAGTYTEEATLFFFPEAKELFPEETVQEAIADVLEGRSVYAVIPQENTLGGAVTGYVDALIAQEDVRVVGEVILPINQTLLGVPGATLSDIQRVCSHAQGLTQSEKWRKENLPEAKAEEMASTAAAASFVAEEGDPSIAAIAAPRAAELYGLSVLAENVQISDANKTRFYVLSGKESEEVEEGQVEDKAEEAEEEKEEDTRAVFVATCEANRIDDIIVEIHASGLEMVALHDRPEGSALGVYHYLIEVEGDEGVEEKVSALEESLGIRLLGTFACREKMP